MKKLDIFLALIVVQNTFSMDCETVNEPTVNVEKCTKIYNAITPFILSKVDYVKFLKGETFLDNTKFFEDLAKENEAREFFDLTRVYREQAKIEQIQNSIRFLCLTHGATHEEYLVLFEFLRQRVRLENNQNKMHKPQIYLKKRRNEDNESYLPSPKRYKYDE